MDSIQVWYSQSFVISRPRRVGRIPQVVEDKSVLLNSSLNNGSEQVPRSICVVYNLILTSSPLAFAPRVPPLWY